jgi:hypothetical protein
VSARKSANHKTGYSARTQNSGAKNRPLSLNPSSKQHVFSKVLEKISSTYNKTVIIR